MPIINEYHSTNAGQGFGPEMLYPEGCMMQTGAMPAVVNMGGDAVTGYAIRYATIDELNTQSDMFNEMGMNLFLYQGMGGARGCSRANMRMNP